MKQFFLQQLKNILKLLAQLTLAKYQPSIIGITGSAGKTSTKEAIFAVLKNARRVRAASASFNNELGLPLTILGDWEKVNGVFFWPKVIVISIWRLIARSPYPEILILEYGIQKPGDMKYLLEIARPSIGVMTAVGEVPVHVEFFSGSDAVAREKGRLLESVPAVGFAVANADDEVVYDIARQARAHVMAFGFNKDADVRISNFENLSTEEKPFGITFKLLYGGVVVPVRFKGIFGKPQAYAAAAATCIGIIFGINLVKIAESLANDYVAPKRRMTLREGMRGSYIIDDSYNASPLSTHAAIETIKDLAGKRKIAVLGDMRELGKYNILAHQEIGRLAARVFEFLFTVGDGGKIIAESAVKEGGIQGKNVKTFDSAEDAAVELKNLLKSGDLVLIKASRAMRLDKISDAAIAGSK